MCPKFNMNIGVDCQKILAILQVVMYKITPVLLLMTSFQNKIKASVVEMHFSFRHLNFQNLFLGKVLCGQNDKKAFDALNVTDVYTSL